MILPDPTLKRIRLLESQSAFITEASQPYDEFVKQVQAFYNKNGANVSYDLTYKIIDALGVENADTPEGAQFAQEVKKNPQKLLTTILKKKGISVEQLEQMIQQDLVPSGNKQMIDLLQQMLDKMKEIEVNTSGAYSTLGVMSSDVYQMTQQFYNRMGERKRNGKNDPIMAKIYTGEEINFLNPSGEVLKGTVLFDTDDPNLSQEFINKMASTVLTESKKIINEILDPRTGQDVRFPRTPEEAKAIPNTLFVQVGGKIYMIDKSQILTEEEAAWAQENVQNLPKEVKSLIKMPELFFSPITGNAKQDDRIRKDIAHSVGATDYYLNRADARAQKMGFSAIPSMSGGQEEGRTNWNVAIPSNTNTIPALMILLWIAENYSQSGIKREGNRLYFKDVRISNNVLTNSFVTIHFRKHIKEADLTNVVNMIVQNVDIKQLRDFCKKNRISYVESGSNTQINNTFVNK